MKRLLTMCQVFLDGDHIISRPRVQKPLSSLTSSSDRFKTSWVNTDKWFSLSVSPRCVRWKNYSNNIEEISSHDDEILHEKAGLAPKVLCRRTLSLFKRSLPTSTHSHDPPACQMDMVYASSWTLHGYETPSIPNDNTPSHLERIITFTPIAEGKFAWKDFSLNKLWLCC